MMITYKIFIIKTIMKKFMNFYVKFRQIIKKKKNKKCILKQ